MDPCVAFLCGGEQCGPPIIIMIIMMMLMMPHRLCPLALSPLASLTRGLEVDKPHGYCHCSTNLLGGGLRCAVH
jgi:hypothetical protein